jgi:hypothetical protein
MKKMFGTMLSACALLLGVGLFGAGQSQAATVTQIDITGR